MPLKTLRTTWEVRYLCDLGNIYQGTYRLDIPTETYNRGTPGEFTSAYPTERQIRSLMGVNYELRLDGDDTHIDVSRARDEEPIGSLFCVSHESLSPIRPKKD